MGFPTLGTPAETKIFKEESYALSQSFTSKVAVGKSCIVKYDAATEKVEPIALLADIPFGVVTRGTQDAADGIVTVVTPFCMIAKGQATAAIAAGDKVGADGYDTATELTTYSVQVLNGTVAGIALEDALLGASFKVGILRTFGEVV